MTQPIPKVEEIAEELASEWLEDYAIAEEGLSKPPRYFKDRPGGFLLWLRVGELHPDGPEDEELSHEEWQWTMEEVLDKKERGSLNGGQ